MSVDQAKRATSGDWNWRATGRRGPSRRLLRTPLRRRLLRRRTRRRHLPRRPERRGLALPLVLVVLAMMVQVAYQLNETMVESSRRAMAHLHAARATEAASSGLRLAAAWLSQSRSQEQKLGIGAEHLFVEHSLASPDDRTAGFQFLAPPWSQARWGMEDESAKLSINALPLEKEQEEPAREMLLKIPGMTVQVADALLDWIDDDDAPRAFGAEQTYYASLRLPPPRNGRIDSLEELLQVRGVTPELLYGSDRNADGLVDAGEARDALRGVEHGWVRYLTAVARESNLRRDGTAKIYLNAEDAVDLYDLLEPRVGAEMAKYLAALRKFGPYDDPAMMEKKESAAELEAAAIRRAAKQLGEASESSDAGLPAAVEEEVEAEEERDTVRDGVDLAGQPSFRIRSLADLCGLQVQIPSLEKDEVLDSPWPADAEGFQRVVQELGDEVTLFAGHAVEGRINVNEAPWEVLATIPGLSPDVARAIEARRSGVSGGSLAAGNNGDVTWLLTDGLMEWKVFREAMPFLTLRGDLFTVRCVGSAANQTVHEYLLAHIDASNAEIAPWRRSSQIALSHREVSPHSKRTP